MTKQELSKRSGVSISFLSDLTSGKANPSLEVMEAVAKALDTPLPLLLENNDLDEGTLDALTGDKISKSLPPGYVWASGILTKYEAFQIRLWDAKNCKKLKQLRHK